MKAFINSSLLSSALVVLLFVASDVPVAAAPPSAQLIGKEMASDIDNNCGLPWWIQSFCRDR